MTDFQIPNIRFLSENEKNYLQKNWNTLSDPAKTCIIFILNEGKNYERNAIRQAIRKDAKFPQKISLFLYQKRKETLLKIEREEQFNDSFRIPT